jgi:uncharacterized protein YndB with AHSA1/START domain
MQSIHDQLLEKSASDAVFSLTHTVDAPRDLVWRVWTEEEHLKHWWGPKGFTMKHCTVDLRPGGLFHYGMVAPDGLEMWGKWEFVEINPQDGFTYILSFSDKEGGTARHFAHQTWPLKMYMTISFRESGGRTVIALANRPLEANEEEVATFREGMEGMNQGFGGTMRQLDAYLAGLRP